MVIGRGFALALFAGLVVSPVLPSAAVAQDAGAPEATPDTPPASPECCPDMVRLGTGTPIRLMVLNEVTTRTAKPGDRFVLRVDEPVLAGGVTVIPVGATAWGEIQSAEGSGVVGKSGKLGARLLYVDVGGTHLALTGENRTAGAGGTTETVLGVIALGPLGLLARGNNAKLKAGEILNGFIASGVLFDPASGRLYSQPAE